MANWTLELDHAGIGEYLRSADVAANINTIANQVAAAVPDATVATDVSDRARALVSVAVTRGIVSDATGIRQVNNLAELGGKLIAAATVAGLEVRARQ